MAEEAMARIFEPADFAEDKRFMGELVVRDSTAPPR
jgi:hypothetical protein